MSTSWATVRPPGARRPSRRRYREREGRPAARLALDPDPPAVQLHELLCESEPEPCALRLLVRGADLAELFEHRLEILCGDADTGVSDGDRGLPIRRHGRDLDPP